MYHNTQKHGLRSIVTQLTLGLLALPLASSYSYTDIETRDASVKDCFTQRSVPYQDSSSSSWNQTISPYNLRLAYTPAIVALPTATKQVSDAVVCAAAAGLKVQAKSGGHSYASYSTGGKDGSVVISLENFNSVSLDNKTNIATVGGGVRLGNLALGLYNQGHRAVPHGTCPGVGVGGHFTHGGYGYTSRLWGLSLDTIVGLDVVLANGTQIHTTATEYPDVFYAMRGAGDSFAIATAFYIKTFEAPSEVITFQIIAPETLKDVNTAVNTFLKLQEFALDSSKINGNLTFGFYTDVYGGFSVSGWCISCDANQFNSTTFPQLVSAFPHVNSTSVKSLGWLDALVSANNGGKLEEPLTGYDAHDTFYAKSVVTKNEEPLTSTQLASFFNFILNEGKNAPSPWYTIINLYGGPGSQINVPSSDSSAYSDRGALWVFQNYGFTDPGKWKPEVTPFVDSLNDALSANASTDFGIYLNYADPELNATEVSILGYGQPTYNKLLSIKKAIDPNEVFWNPQSIGAADDKTSSPSTTTRSTVKVKPDGTCGGEYGCTEGNCCSPFGFCGAGPAYCGSTQTGPNAPSTTLKTSTDGSCGNGYKCTEGNCCSVHGYCGNTGSFCGAGCQSAFGKCN
ncbi:hypothetical protein EYC80_003720 [Monilinia laxa]|uniref:Chitin-binding type-1 domain-containing protein n=1 Tax=Monilinia laxa TaxID=61186 RepID=A0A5N6KKI6_MONLA|nr:hypothetical protein EYC80_003720 [Monilinia laxa]